MDDSRPGGCPAGHRYRRVPVVVGLVIAAVGASLLYVDLDLPLVRNGEVYAHAAYSLAEKGDDPGPVVADRALSCAKPIGFAFLGTPLVERMGANRGLKVLSFAGTLLLVVVSALFMARLNRVFGLDSRLLAGELVLVWGNPLMLYQFWSAYPDALFAALVLGALLVFDTILHGERSTTTTAMARTFLLAALILAAITVKYYGAILLGLLPLFYLMSRAENAPAGRSQAVRIALAAVWMLAAVHVITAILGTNPVLRFGGRGSGYPGYAATLFDPPRLALYTGLGLANLLCLPLLILAGVAVVLVGRWNLRRALGDRRRRGYCLAAAILGAALLPSPATFYNPRYFIPIVPFLAVLAAARLSKRTVFVRRWLWASFAAVQLALIANFNLPVVHEALRGPNRAVRPLFDNLRMGAHLDRRDGLQAITREVEPGRTLYLVSSYYDGCTAPSLQRLWSEAGMSTAGAVDVRARRDLTAVDGDDRPYYVYADRLYRGDRSRRIRTADLEEVLPGRVANLGHGLFRVDPLSPGGIH